MKLTNKNNLPEPIFNAVKNDPYSRGSADISVTQLIGPPRKVALERKHEEEMTEDASDRIWSLLGQSIHTILERSNQTPIATERMFIKVEDWTISGQSDLYENDGTLTDYKVTSVWSAKDGENKEEWINQLNVYAEMLRGMGKMVNKVQIVAILRDWNQMRAKREPDLPQSQVVVIPILLWSRETAQRYIRERVILHKQARIELPECSAYDRWESPAVYAVMKPGRKSAVKLFDREPEANAMAAGVPGNFVVHRKGMSMRCENYCNVSSFCSQFKESRDSQMNDAE